MKLLSVLPFAALIGVSAMPFVSTSASAGIVCNADGDWLAYPDRLPVSADIWPNRPSERLEVEGSEKHAWREHDGKGYWKGGFWQSFLIEPELPHD